MNFNNKSDLLTEENMDNKIKLIAQRIYTLRDILDISVEDMASATDTTVEQYLELEQGESDFSFTFLHNAANKFGVDLVELLTGEDPKLSFYAVTRKDKGITMQRRKGFHYMHLASTLKDKKAEAFVVTAPYNKDCETAPIEMSHHKGQELDFVLSGSLLMSLEGKTEILHEGDSIMYDSSYGHGMVATGGTECKFIAVVID